MNKYIIKLITVFSFLLLMSMPLDSVQAQCPMCKLSAETNLANGGTAGKGLNKGILYMLLTPYLIVGGIGFVWYRNRQKTKEEELDIVAE